MRSKKRFDFFFKFFCTSLRRFVHFHRSLHCAVVHR
ncbi:Uncharacterised protein [Vibrio cholerae]|nr:Uncharacterised protein [Vibrio cholerae]